MSKRVEVRLSVEEIELLYEALEAWADEPSTRGLFEAMAVPLAMEEEREIAEVRGEIAEEVRSETKSRERRVVLLQAKLIRAQDRAVAEELFSRPDQGEGGSHT